MKNKINQQFIEDISFQYGIELNCDASISTCGNMGYQYEGSWDYP